MKFALLWNLNDTLCVITSPVGLPYSRFLKTYLIGHQRNGWNAKKKTGFITVKIHKNHLYE
jgi:hypothetical protein